MARRNTRRRISAGEPDSDAPPDLGQAQDAHVPTPDAAELDRIAPAALAAALEAIPSPAFVLRQPGAVLHANERGRAMLAAEHDRVKTFLHNLSPPPRGPSRYALDDAPEHQLVVVHDLERDARARLAAVTRRWGLTPRQSAVLELVAQGDSNRTVAGRLGCSEKTVELHVSALLAKTRCASRSQLVASFWTDPG